MYEVSIKTEFAAAHNLRNYEGACETLHGHNWKVDVVVAADRLDEAGLAVDFKVLKEKTDRIIGELDHTYLNEHEAFRATNPSSENIARYIFDELKSDIGNHARVNRVTIWETDDAAASYYED